MSVVFTWDSVKAASNQKDHDISLEEAVTAFADPLARIFDDQVHSEAEVREVLVGYSSHPRLLVVSFTQRGPVVRVISARLATPRERRRHEKADQG